MKIEKLQKADISQLLDLYKMLVPFENTVEKSQAIYEEMLKDRETPVLKRRLVASLALLNRLWAMLVSSVTFES